jgi:hypothetical protein
MINNSENQSNTQYNPDAACTAVLNVLNNLANQLQETQTASEAQWNDEQKQLATTMSNEIKSAVANIQSTKDVLTSQDPNHPHMGNESRFDSILKSTSEFKEKVAKAVEANVLSTQIKTEFDSNIQKGEEEIRKAQEIAKERSKSVVEEIRESNVNTISSSTSNVWENIKKVLKGFFGVSEQTQTASPNTTTQTDTTTSTTTSPDVPETTANPLPPEVAQMAKEAAAQIEQAAPSPSNNTTPPTASTSTENAESESESETTQQKK